MEQVIEKATKITDAQYNAKWDSMLKVFTSIINDSPEPEKVKDKLESLKESAQNTDFLTPRQKEGIYARCDNYLNGTYGQISGRTSEYLKNQK